ncbi:type II toxin-antitoxin system HipA family toxin [Erwinia sp. E602]|nr:type II toxin-antitoxin system HipA family toxin [Erwinia sp. E602]
MTRCRILLTPLNGEAARAKGYSVGGLKALTGQSRTEPQLSFTRSQFVQELPQKQKGMSISGYQPKLQMILQDLEFTVIDKQGEYILKPSPVEFPRLAENEHATMTLMSRLGFDVPPCGLLAFRSEQAGDEEEYAFVIKRFDRTAGGKGVHHEQLDAAMDIDEKYGKIADDGKSWISYEQIARFLVANVNDNLAFRIDLFRRIVYAYLLGNNDMHLRNFGLLLPQDKPPQLSPLYDFVSVVPYQAYFTAPLALPLLACEEGDKALAGGFSTRYGEYLGMDFLVLAESIGLSKRLTAALLTDLVKEQEIVESTYRESFMPEDDVEAVLRYYRSRLSRLQILDEPAL